MDKLGVLIEYTFYFFFSLYLDFVIFDPIIQDFVELGLNTEITVGGVTAPAKELMGSTNLYLYNLMWYIISLAGIFSAISGIIYYLKKNIRK